MGRWDENFGNTVFIEIWDTLTGECKSTFRREGRAINALQSSDNSTALVAFTREFGDRFESLHIWNVISHQCITILNHTSVGRAAFTQNGSKLFYLSGWPHEVWSVELPSGRRSRVFVAEKYIHALAISPTGEKIAASSDDEVSVLDLTSTEQLTSLAQRERVEALAFSVDGKWSASISINGTLQIWDSTTGHCRAIPNAAPEKHNTNFLVFSADGQRLASSCSEQDIKIWDTTTDIHCQPNLEGYRFLVDKVVLSADETLAASFSCGNITMWEVTTGRSLLPALDYH